MMHSRLAFVDVETTGLGHGEHRIAEIGVVTVDGERVAEWEALLDPGRRVESPAHEFGGERGYFCADRATELPRFRDIAAGLAARLKGRLLIAHNARFDYAFIKAEFEREGIAFAPPALCTVMLSRKLFPKHDRHDLDALIERHGLAAEERHRALPDARALFRFWQAIHRDVDAERIAGAIDALLAEPLLPAHIDLGMIDALPDRPGIFMLDGPDGELLHAGRAANLRRHVKRYFRLDRHCTRAAALSERLTRIRWQAASGPLDAALCEMALRREIGERSALQRHPVFSIRIDPAAAAAVASIVPLSEADAVGDELFGLYSSERKAANALRKLAAAKPEPVCLRLLGLKAKNACACANCIGTSADGDKGSRQRRARNLLRLMAALAPLRIKPWPYPGPIAIREGRSVHVFDRWEFLGTVRTGSDMQALLDVRRNGFDPDIYRLLTRALPRLSQRALHVIPVPEPGAAGPRSPIES